MASGSYNNNSNTPPLYSAYERYEMGWITPEDITHRTDAINSLPNLGDSNKLKLMLRHIVGSWERHTVLEVLVSRWFTVGLHDVHMLVCRSIVHLVFLPHLPVVVDMPYEHALAWQISVPSLKLSVFEQEILVVLARHAMVSQSPGV